MRGGHRGFQARKEPAWTSQPWWELAWACLQSRDDGVVKLRSRMTPELWLELLDAALKEVPESNQPGSLFGLDTVHPKYYPGISCGFVILNVSVIACYRLFKDQSVLFLNDIFLITILCKNYKINLL